MTEAAFVTVCCYFCECMWTAVFFQKHSLMAKIFLLHTCFQTPWFWPLYDAWLCMCVCVLATDEENCKDEGSRPWPCLLQILRDVLC